MPLEVSFAIQKTELLLGEDTMVRLQLKNRGENPLVVVDPRGGGMPVYRVVELSTGAEMLMEMKQPPRRGPSMMEIPAGGVEEAWISLLRDIKWPAPGEYAVSAICSYNYGKDRAETPPVRVKVRPWAARNLFLDVAHGSVVTGVFVNPAADPPDVVLVRFRIEAGGGVDTVETIGKGTILTRPVNSLPANLQIGTGEWVAWVDENMLRFVHWDSDEQKAVEGKFKISGSDPEIVAPLYIEPSAPNAARSNGGALVWASNESRAGTVLHAIRLQAASRAAKAELEGSLALPGPRPEWAMSYAFSDCIRRLVCLRPANGRLELFSMPWPAGQPAAPMRPLQQWEGEFVAAGATPRSDDQLCGAVLMWTGQGESRKLELIGWMLSKLGKVSEHYRESIPWGSSAPVSKPIVKVRITGLPAVLLRKHGMEWLIYDAFGKLMPVPPPYSATNLPLDFVFFGLQEVLLICGELVGGFSVKRMDGSDLPPRAK